MYVEQSKTRMEETVCFLICDVSEGSQEILYGSGSQIF